MKRKWTLTQIQNRNMIKHSTLRAQQPFNLTNWPNHHEISFMQFQWNENIPYHRLSSCLMYLCKIYDDAIADDESHLIQNQTVMWLIKLNQQSLFLCLSSFLDRTTCGEQTWNWFEFKFLWVKTKSLRHSAKCCLSKKGFSHLVIYIYVKILYR